MRKPLLPMPIDLSDPRLKPHTPVVAANNKPWYRIRNESESGGSVEVMIYGTIGASYWSDGVSASDFARELNDIDADEITVRINSQGGSVFEGIAILNALRGHDAKIVTVIDGLAASAASFIAMGGDEIVMGRNAEMMIHDASGLCVGNASDMEFMTGLLDKTSDNIAAIYADRAGGTAKQWRAEMRKETWYSDKETVAAGLADRIGKATSKTDTDTKNFDLSVFNYAGRRKAPTPAFPADSSADRAGATKKEQQMPQTLKEAIAKRLGMSADATDDDLIEKLEADDDGDDTDTSGTDTDKDTDTTGSDSDSDKDKDKDTETDTESGAQNRAGTPGTVVIDEQRLANLEAGNQRLNAYLAEQTALENKKVIDNAMKAGKIPSQRRDHWANLLDKDPGIADVLAAMPAGGAVPIGEIGHGVDDRDGADTSASSLEAIRNSPEFKNWSE